MPFKNMLIRKDSSRYRETDKRLNEKGLVGYHKSDRDWGWYNDPCLYLSVLNKIDSILPNVWL